MQPQTNPPTDTPPTPPPQSAEAPPSPPPDLMVPSHQTVISSAISTETQPPQKTPEEIRAQLLMGLLEATELAQASMRKLLGNDAPPEELMGALFPGWRPPVAKPTDVWLLARIELFINGKFIPVCAVQHALPGVLRPTMLSVAADSMETAILQSIKNPVLAEFLEHLPQSPDGKQLPALRS